MMRGRYCSSFFQLEDAASVKFKRDISLALRFSNACRHLFRVQEAGSRNFLEWDSKESVSKLWQRGMHVWPFEQVNSRVAISERCIRFVEPVL